MFEKYILRLHVTTKTNHKPLTSILNQKNFNEITPRIQTTKTKPMRYA